MIDKSALTVSQLNTYVKMLFDSDNLLYKVCVTGEISNFVNHYKTGHCYFTLKDASSAIKAVMFAGNAKNLRFRPENGMKVIITGRVSVFERDGVYQIYAETMEPEGAGSLMIAFEQLKQKLTAEGIFSDELKKPLPSYPQKIAVITSPVGAALQDIINVISRRYPICEIVFCPVAVQGVKCADENISALKAINKRNDIDLIILGRGGGSIEDLWGYNDEQLVRTVAMSCVPVITGIGHETDFTLCDFAADLRAPTPSAAAEISVPDIQELIQINDSFIYRLDKAVFNILEEKADKLSEFSRRMYILDPRRVLEGRISHNENLLYRLNSTVNAIISRNEGRLDTLSQKLKVLNPLFMIEKGFIPVYKDNQQIRCAKGLKADDKIRLDFADGNVICNIDEIVIAEK